MLKITRKIASLTTQAAGDITFDASAYWIETREYMLFVNITAITGSPTNVQFSLKENVDGTFFMNGTSTLTATGTGTTKNGQPVYSIGMDAKLNVAFGGGTNPTVTADVYLVCYSGS